MKGNRVLLTLPDGGHIGLNSDEVKEYLSNWYSYTNSNPNTFGHIILKDKCPICNSPLHGKKYDDEIWLWCPSCKYEEIRKI